MALVADYSSASDISDTDESTDLEKKDEIKNWSASGEQSVISDEEDFFTPSASSKTPQAVAGLFADLPSTSSTAFSINPSGKRSTFCTI